jgi:hypothetical protein
MACVSSDVKTSSLQAEQSAVGVCQQGFESIAVPIRVLMIQELDGLRFARPGSYISPISSDHGRFLLARGPAVAQMTRSLRNLRRGPAGMALSFAHPHNHMACLLEGQHLSVKSAAPATGTGQALF